MKKFLILLLLGMTTTALAHSGGTDSSGCHHDRKRGGYHCHKSDGTMIMDEKTRNPASTVGEKVDIKADTKEKTENK